MILILNGTIICTLELLIFRGAFCEFKTITWCDSSIVGYIDIYG